MKRSDYELQCYVLQYFSSVDDKSKLSYLCEIMVSCGKTMAKTGFNYLIVAVVFYIVFPDLWDKTP